MANLAQIESYLKDPTFSWEVRFRELINSNGLTFTNKAWLGEVLLGVTTEKDKNQHKDKIDQLKRFIQSWRARSNGN